MEYTRFIEVLIVIVTISVLSAVSDAGRLDDYIHHFEELHYDRSTLHEHHLRHKRSVQDHVALDINAFGQSLRLKLKRDASIFAPDMTLELNGKIISPDTSFIYSGKVDGEPNSHVHGAIIEGMFRGEVRVPSHNDTYFIEKSRRFFKKQPQFHSVIYRESQMDLDPYRERRIRERREAKLDGSCAFTHAKEWMKSVVDSEVVQENRAKRHTAAEWQGIYSDKKSSKYSAESNQEHKRMKRGSLGPNNSCFMSITSDKFFYLYYYAQANNQSDITRDEILAFFASHVNAINKIYENTNFQTYENDMSYSGVRFTVQKTKIQTPEDCDNNIQPTNSNLQGFCAPNIDVSNFLNMNSLINHDDFCLAYIFTYRDFTQGTLGLAWVGSASSASGGVCERNKKFTEGSSKVAKSLNTGVVTVVNYGKNVPSRVSQLTFAHEVGHNFGSPHDSGPMCAPYGTSEADANQGNYIMFASATMGDKLHNSQFSACSKDNITRVLHAVLTNPTKYNCFKQAGPFCGNNIVEEGEDCDCGYDGDCKDQCCNARGSLENNREQECKLKAGKTCSPTQGPCCDSSCNYISQSSNITCRYEQDCASAAYCNGQTALCPNSTAAPNGSFCANYGFTCQKGECAGSLCQKFGWQECFVTGPATNKDEQEKLCKLGCRQNLTSECILSSNTDELLKYPAYKDMVDEVKQKRVGAKPSDGVELAPGSPCNNFQGYCDVFHRCRGVDAEGPLSRLKNLIFNPETLQDISNWIVEHWWAVLIMAIGLVVAMALFIHFCAVHTPSSNPKAKPARKLSETMTLRRRRNQNRPPPQMAEPVRYPQTKTNFSAI